MQKRVVALAVFWFLNICYFVRAQNRESSGYGYQKTDPFKEASILNQLSNSKISPDNSLGKRPIGYHSPGEESGLFFSLSPTSFIVFCWIPRIRVFQLKKKKIELLFCPNENIHETPIYKTDKIKLFWLKQGLQMLRSRGFPNSSSSPWNIFAEW